MSENKMEKGSDVVVIPDCVKSSRFDVHYNSDKISIDYHFCRQWDEHGGCYGTNPDHGYSFEEACDEMADWHEQQAKAFRDRTHHSLAHFLMPEPVPEDFDF